MNRLRADLLLVGIAVIWGLAFVFQKTAMAHLEPFTFLAARALVAAAVLGLLAWQEGGGRKGPGSTNFLGPSILGGIAFCVAGYLQQRGLVTATVINSGFLTGLYVIVTPLLMWAMLHQTPRPHVWLAVAIAFLGTWLLGGGTVGGFSEGDLLVALSSVFWAAHILIVAQAARHARPIAFTAVQFAVVAVLAGAGALVTEPISREALWAAAPEIAFVGILSSAVTFTLLAVALKHTPPAEAAIIVSLETVFAALAGMILLGENLAMIGWFGAAMMLTATLIVQAAPSVEARQSGNT